MRRTATVVAIVAISVLSMATALATPPTGEFKYQDYARVQVVGSAAVPITGGSTLMSGLYSVAPGGESGWRRLPGTMVLAVTKGKLLLHASEGCSAKDYAAGQAAVVPAGVYRVHNPGSEPLEFFGLFFDQTAGAPKPLAEGPTEAGPSNCSGIKAAGAPSGVSLNSPAAGAFVNSFYSSNATLDVKGGQDVFATHYEFAPGASTGWVSHRPAVNIIERGELTVVEARDGKCDESEVYTAGQAYYHPAHRHMGINKGKEPLVVTAVYFNLPHQTPLPAIGNQTDAVDFTQAPPAECPRLR